MNASQWPLFLGASRLDQMGHRCRRFRLGCLVEEAEDTTARFIQWAHTPQQQSLLDAPPAR